MAALSDLFMLMASSGSNVLDTKNDRIYIRRTVYDYQMPPRAWHGTQRNLSALSDVEIILKYEVMTL